MNDATRLLKQKLAGFYGCDEFYSHALNRKVLYTEGVRAFAQGAGSGAYWLLDILATEPAILKEAREFADVNLKVTGTTAVLTVTDGGKDDSPDVEVYRREISYTDCPEGDWHFYFENMTIMLPSER